MRIWHGTGPGVMGWFYRLGSGPAVGPHWTKAEATAAAQAQDRADLAEAHRCPECMAEAIPPDLKCGERVCLNCGAEECADCGEWDGHEPDCEGSSDAEA